MKKSFFKKIIIGMIIFIVVVILFSNLGQNFKYDIFSYDNAASHATKINSTWLYAQNYQDYINKTADYISATLRDNNVSPYNEGKYIYEWTANTPSLKYTSSLEVITRYGRIVKKFQYKSDYFEDYRGAIKPGVIVNKAGYVSNLSNETSITSEIILFDGYKGKSPEEIKNIDDELILKGVRCVLSPASSSEIISESGIDNSDLLLSNSNKNLIKILVSSSAFDDIKQYIRKGYSLKVKSGAEIKTSTFKNVYGILEGKNHSYKPLIVISFFDGEYKIGNTNGNSYLRYTITPSIALECMRSLKLQRPQKPDRTIIFAFVSGYPQNKEGLVKFFNSKFDGDAIVLDGLGTGSKCILSYYKPSRYFIETLEHFANKNDINIISKNDIYGTKQNTVYISALDSSEKNNINYQNINNSGRFLLSFIGEESYNLDFLSGNIPEIRAYKQIIRENTLLIAFSVLIILIVTVFRFQE